LREEGARGLISNYRDLKMERRAREGGWVRSVSRSAPLQQKKRRGAREEEEGDADRWGRCVSDIEEKKGGGGNWAAAGGRKMGRWAGWAEGGEVLFLFFFSFSNSFKIQTFSTQISFKISQTFSKNFVDFLNLTQATKTMHSQIMMHLLSLN
jgi:hypothetical protein